MHWGAGLGVCKRAVRQICNVSLALHSSLPPTTTTTTTTSFLNLLHHHACLNKLMSTSANPLINCFKLWKHSVTFPVCTSPRLPASQAQRVGSPPPTHPFARTPPAERHIRVHRPLFCQEQTCEHVVSSLDELAYARGCGSVVHQLINRIPNSS